MNARKTFARIVAGAAMVAIALMPGEALAFLGLFESKLTQAEMEKMDALMGLIFAFDEKMRKAVAAGADINAIAALPVRERVGRAKSVKLENYKTEYAAILAEMDEQIAALAANK